MNAALRRASPINGEGGAVPSRPSTSGLERMRLAKARLYEMEIATRERKLIDREEIHSFMVKLSRILRQAGETLQRQYGPDALRIMDDALDEFDRIVNESLAQPK